jgi:hypothetical protein
LPEEVIVNNGVASDVVSAINRSQATAVLDRVLHRLGPVGIGAEKRVDESQPGKVAGGCESHLIDRRCLLSCHESRLASVRFEAF